MLLFFPLLNSIKRGCRLNTFYKLKRQPLKIKYYYFVFFFLTVLYFPSNQPKHRFIIIYLQYSVVWWLPYHRIGAVKFEAELGTTSATARNIANTFLMCNFFMSFRSFVFYYIGCIFLTLWIFVITFMTTLATYFAFSWIRWIFRTTIFANPSYGTIIKFTKITIIIRLWGCSRSIVLVWFRATGCLCGCSGRSLFHLHS